MRSPGGDTRIRHPNKSGLRQAMHCGDHVIIPSMSPTLAFTSTQASDPSMRPLKRGVLHLRDMPLGEIRESRAEGALDHDTTGHDV